MKIASKNHCKELLKNFQLQISDIENTVCKFILVVTFVLAFFASSSSSSSLIHALQHPYPHFPLSFPPHPFLLLSFALPIQMTTFHQTLMEHLSTMFASVKKSIHGRKEIESHLIFQRIFHWGQMSITFFGCVKRRVMVCSIMA